MELQRLAAAMTFVCIIAGATPLYATAAPPHGHPHGHPHGRRPHPSAGARDVISGTVVGVDYGTGSMLVAAPGGRAVIEISPSTSIFNGGNDASMADLHTGAHVDVNVSNIGGRLVAQIIRIR